MFFATGDDDDSTELLRVTSIYRLAMRQPELSAYLFSALSGVPDEGSIAGTCLSEKPIFAGKEI